MVLWRTRMHGEWFGFSRPLCSLLAAMRSDGWAPLLKRLAVERETFAAALVLRELILQHLNCFGLPPLSLEEISQ